MGKEIRIIPADLEIREAEGNKRTITGYAVKWGQWSAPISEIFRERFEKGSLTESVRDDNQIALWSHDLRCVLGNTKNRTLRFIEDDIGLGFEIDPANTSWGNDAYTSILRGDVDGVSFAFKVGKEGDYWDTSDPNMIKRTIRKARLFEVSPTPFPAYPQTEVQARSIDKAYEEYRAANQGPEPVTQDESIPDNTEAMEKQRKEYHRIKSKIYQVYEGEK